MATPYRIFHSPDDPIGPIKPLRNFLEQDDLLTNIRWAAWKGLRIGIVLGLNDIIIVNQIDTLRARWARMSYIVPPYVAATVSFVCAREALGNISAEKGNTNMGRRMAGWPFKMENRSNWWTPRE